MSACTCGRSPTDNCVGWHNLTEDKYLEKKAAHEARKAEKAAQRSTISVGLLVGPIFTGAFFCWYEQSAQVTHAVVLATYSRKVSFL